VEELAKTIGASEAETGGILRALIEGGDLSAWGVINAVTAQAHTAKDYDRSVDFENAGGQLLELPRSDWKRILEAA
jgi:alkylated DNA nucleotide flippase Atl1